MEVKVELCLSKGLEKIANRLISAIEGVSVAPETPVIKDGKTGVPGETGGIVLQPVNEPVEAVSDVEMAAPVKKVEAPVKEATGESEAADYPALRKEIKNLGIKLVQAKKQSSVKALTAKYGCSKITDLPDDKLEDYLAELKEI